jgi:hypothetical protein
LGTGAAVIRGAGPAGLATCEITRERIMLAWRSPDNDAESRARFIASRCAAIWRIFCAATVAALFAVSYSSATLAQTTDVPVPPAPPVDTDVIYATEPIELVAGAAYVEWTVRRDEPSTGCTASASLRQEGDSQPLRRLYAVRLPVDGDIVEMGKTSLDGVAPGSYLAKLRLKPTSGSLLDGR